MCFREEKFGSLDITETLMNKIDFPQKPIFLCYVGYTFLIWHRITLSNLHEIRQNIIALKEGKLYFDSGSLENFLARSVPSLIHHQKIEKILICWWPNSFAIDLWSYMYKIQCVPFVILEFLVSYSSYLIIKFAFYLAQSKEKTL